MEVQEDMKINKQKSGRNDYQMMRNIMKGLFNASELVNFLIGSKDNLLTNKLKSYLEAICDSAAYRLDTALFNKPVIDIVGTGGDGKHTVNISTLAAFICAATSLVYVAKYGNKSASGICGSMDLIEKIGINIKQSKKQNINQLKEFGFTPLFAQAIYPGGRFLAEARKKVGKPTIFNLLFPLARPVIGKQRFIFGCAGLDQMKVVAKIYQNQKNVRCLIVHGQDGTDEISVSGNGKTNYILIEQGRIKFGIFDCKKIFDISPIDLDLLQVSSKQMAVERFKAVINPQIKNKKIEAIRNAAIANAAVALFIGLDEGEMDISYAKKYLEVSNKALSSGKVFKLMENLKEEQKYGFFKTH